MNEKKWWKNYSAFQIVSVFLIALLVLAIIIELGIIISLKQKVDDANHKNEELEEMLHKEENAVSWQQPFIISIENLNNQFQ